MNVALQGMLDRYQPQTLGDHENALQEIVQELALLGLWRAKFFERAAFYGGTALRIFHRLPRFSEDIDFSLLQPDREFNLAPCLEAVRKELAAFGFSFRIERRNKRVSTAIESAFIKGGTRINLARIGTPDYLRARLPDLQQVRIRIELDTDPPPLADYEVLTLLTPIPFQVRLFDLPCLFAGKLHAILCRNWKSRVKGRDFYDLLWYLGRQIPCNLRHLQARMVQTGHWQPDRELAIADLRRLLRDRFGQVDFDQARSDVRPFIRDDAELELWNTAFFQSLAERVEASRAA
ncbi:MAG: nucleotidyl transferase AbiEii/AbiGii toxin family protein [Spirochaetaceae bacterium]|nr:nucleotidyl transferase AbiEii/AbiGii toxin family protein [Spirochaetaceae bacterium]